MRRIRFSAGLIALVLLVGCGGGSGSKTTASAPPPNATSPPPTVTQRQDALGQSTAEIQTTPTPTSPEQQQGGTGDEQPISTQAEFTGKGGDITPATIRVPPFIAVDVVLHSADGGDYGIEVAHHALSVSASNPTATVQLSGLRAGRRYAVDVTGAPERLAIVANAEPGP